MSLIARGLPIPAQEILRWLPHRKPMFWLDEILEAKDLYEGTCTVKVEPDAHFMYPDGRIRTSSFIEFAAQAHGVLSLYQSVAQHGEELPALSKAYMASIKSARLLYPAEELTFEKLGPTLTIRIHSSRKFGPLVLFHGECSSPSLGPIHECQLKVFSEFIVSK